MMSLGFKLRNAALRAVLLSASLVFLNGGAARAQGFAGTFFDDDVLPPRVIAWRLADRGFSGISRPRFDGRFYLVNAISPAGAPVRLVLDPGSGRIVGQDRLPGQEVYARLDQPPVRSLPGYGWTEEDVARPLAAVPGTSAVARPQRRSGLEAPRPSSDANLQANPLGLNPDSASRAEQPRRIARTSPVRTPDKPPARVSPAAPAPKVVPAAARPEPAPPPAANVSPTPEPKDAAAPSTDAKPVAQAGPKQDWKDPPAEGKRPVRVIGGPTIVPGTPDKDGEAPKQ